jgi:hypothetical protein
MMILMTTMMKTMMMINRVHVEHGLQRSLSNNNDVRH